MNSTNVSHQHWSEHKTDLCKLCNSDAKNVGKATGNKNITLNIELSRAFYAIHSSNGSDLFYSSFYT